MGIDVLIMDDTAIVRERIVKLLSDIKDIGKIIQAVDAESAVWLVREHKPQIVILDIQVPGSDKLRNGIDVLKSVVRYTPSTAVIMLSNYASSRYREECQREGARFIFDKSSEFDQLPTVIREIVQSSQ